MHKRTEFFLTLTLLTVCEQVAAYKSIRNQMPIEPELEEVLPNQKPKQQ